MTKIVTARKLSKSRPCPTDLTIKGLSICLLGPEMLRDQNIPRQKVFKGKRREGLVTTKPKNPLVPL